jgi:hypothetical protein
MYRPVHTRQFKRDIKSAEKQGRNIDQFILIARSLLAGGNAISNPIGCLSIRSLKIF